MTDFLWYILKVNVCIVVLYMFYILLLSKCTFFFLNRIYLLSGLILSFIVPLIDFSIFGFYHVPEFFVVQAFAPPVISGDEYFQTINQINYVDSFNYWLLLPVIYITGCIILFFKLLFSFVKIVRIKNNSEIIRQGRLKIVINDQLAPFSFFHFIFLPEKESNLLIIDHEKAHITQLHWLDLLLVEFTVILFWCNPFVYFYKNSLKLQHEYLADKDAVRDGKELPDYLGCLLEQVEVAATGKLTSPFYHKTIKKRITMIIKNRTPYKYIIVYLFVLPLIGVLSAFTNPRHAAIDVFSIPSNAMAFNETDVIPSIYPVNMGKAKVTAQYGNRQHPVKKTEMMHIGMDFAIPVGEKVFSTADGIVVEADNDKKKGNYVRIKHNGEYSTLYSHLNRYSVKNGDEVKKGQVIGETGNTGYSTGPHLHYEVHKNGKTVNPADYLPE